MTSEIKQQNVQQRAGPPDAKARLRGRFGAGIYAVLLQ